MMLRSSLKRGEKFGGVKLRKLAIPGRNACVQMRMVVSSLLAEWLGSQ
jgi:hypothetical protein